MLRRIINKRTTNALRSVCTFSTAAKNHPYYNMMTREGREKKKYEITAKSGIILISFSQHYARDWHQCEQHRLLNEKISTKKIRPLYSIPIRWRCIDRECVRERDREWVSGLYNVRTVTHSIRREIFKLFSATFLIVITCSPLFIRSKLPEFAVASKLTHRYRVCILSHQHQSTNSLFDFHISFTSH